MPDVTPKPLTKIAADWTGCPQTTAQVAQARIDWQQRAEAAEAEVRRLRLALERIRQGYSNLLEFRKIAGMDRYGALTREEIEQERALIDAALASQEAHR